MGICQQVGGHGLPETEGGSWLRFRDHTDVFDNSILYSYLYRIREKGITVPVIAGIMPVTNAKQIKRITQMSGTYLPSRFMSIVDRFGDNPAAMKQAGIAYATDQIVDLIANGVGESMSIP